MAENQNNLSEYALLVQKALIEQGLENPLVLNSLNAQEKKAKIALAFTEIMQILGLDLQDDSLERTPHRLSKMYVDELFTGLDYQNFPSVTLIDNKMQSDEMVKVEKISLTSVCEHHFMIIDGFASVAYIPKDKIIGLSKINRIVRFFAQRPQVQERLTKQILVAMQTILKTDDVAVLVKGVHYCVKARGIEDHSSFTTTQAFAGRFKTESALRQEFFQSCSL